MDAQLKQDVIDCIEKVLKVFTVKYTKEYLLQLVRIIEREQNAEPADWQLEDRPRDQRGDLKTGWLLKESRHLKNWNKRFFVFRANHAADYYVSEADLAKGKRRGSLNLAGYNIIEDPNQGILLRLKRLAEKMGMDLSALPKPKEYPPLTFEVHHDRRPSIFLQASSKEEFDQWIKQFRHSAWCSYGLTWDEECHKVAFPKAVRKTRWELGRWGWWTNSGSEEQILCEMIADELEYDIMGKIYSKLPSAAPWFIRNKLRKMAVSAVDTMVMAAVKPGWAGMRKAVEALRPKMEPEIRKALEPLFKAKNDVMDKMREAIMSVIEPLLKEHVTPHLGKIVRIIKSPMTDAFAESMRLFEAKVDKWEAKEDLKASFYDLDYLGRSWWELRGALEKVDEMYDPLWVLREIFTDIWPWSLIWKGHSLIYKKTDAAVYTFEQAISKEEGNKKDVADAVKRDVLMKFKHDADLASMKYYRKILKLIVMPPFEALVHPAAKAIIDPIGDMVPGPLQEFIDIPQMFEDLYTGVIDDSIKVCLNADNNGNGAE